MPIGDWNRFPFRPGLATNWDPKERRRHAVERRPPIPWRKRINLEDALDKRCKFCTPPAETPRRQGATANRKSISKPSDPLQLTHYLTAPGPSGLISESVIAVQVGTATAGPLRSSIGSPWAPGQDSIGHGWTSRPVGKVVVVVGAAAAAAPAWVRPVRSGVVFPLPKMRLQTVPTAAAISA